jgi:hypothetical protein
LLSRMNSGTIIRTTMDIKIMGVMTMMDIMMMGVTMAVILVTFRWLCVVGFGFGVTGRSMVRRWTYIVRQDIRYHGLHFITPVTG